MSRDGTLGSDQLSSVKDDSCCEFKRWFPGVTRRHDDRGNLQHTKCVLYNKQDQEWYHRKIKKKKDLTTTEIGCIDYDLTYDYEKESAITFDRSLALIGAFIERGWEEIYATCPSWSALAAAESVE